MLEAQRVSRDSMWGDGRYSVYALPNTELGRTPSIGFKQAGVVTDKMISESLVQCVGCGALVADTDGATHKYLGASAGCWAVFGKVLAQEFEFAKDAVEKNHYGAMHRLTVDAYCVQHPGVPSRRTIQSAAVHLISLYSVLERGYSAEKALWVMRRAGSHSERFFWLEPPTFMGATTVIDVSRANNLPEHEKLVEEWARASWEAWSQHHEQIRRWGSL